MKNGMTILTMGLLLTVAGCPEVEFEGDDTDSPADTVTGDKDTQDTTDSSPDTGTDSSIQKSCEELAPEQCDEREDCAPINARPLNRKNSCLLPSEPVGCMSADMGCTAAIELSVSPDGECYWFSSGCMPDGWNRDESSCPDDSINWEPCEQNSKACEDLPVASCDESKGCTKIYGRRGIIEDQCLLDSEAVGCMSADAGCGAAITFATDPAGNCYQLPSGCIPKGWSAPDANSGCNYESFPDDKSCDTSSLACEELTAKQCSTRDNCSTISGRHVDTEAKCVFDPEALGCMSADRGCTEAETLAIDSSGDCYWFSNGCLPSGWTGADYDDPTCNFDAVGDLASCN